MRVEREWDASGVGMNRRNEAQKRGRSGETERERSVSGARVEREWSASGAQVERELSGGTRRKSAGDPAKQNASGARVERTARRRSAWSGEEISRLSEGEKTR